MKKVLIGIFNRHEDADAAIDELKKEGIDGNEISVISRTEKLDKYKRDTGGEATAAGAILGGLTGVLVAAAPVVLPGVGIVVAGPLIALMGLTMGALTGGLVGALVDLGLSEEQARSYEARVKRGGALLSVTVNDENEKTARAVMKKHNAEELTAVPYREHRSQRASMHA